MKKNKIVIFLLIALAAVLISCEQPCDFDTATIKASKMEEINKTDFYDDYAVYIIYSDENNNKYIALEEHCYDTWKNKQKWPTIDAWYNYRVYFYNIEATGEGKSYSVESGHACNYQKLNNN